MSTPFLPIRWDSRCVEPAKRMVGGRFGWAVHRFPIKGGKTMRETITKDWGAALSAAASRPSFLADKR